MSIDVHWVAQPLASADSAAGRGLARHGGQLEIADSETGIPKRRSVTTKARVWVAPEIPSQLVGVLRDSRGGNDATRATLVVP